MPLLIGAIGLGAEVSYWRVLHRGMQDAAELRSHCSSDKQQCKLCG